MVAELLVAEAQVAAVLEARRVAHVGLLDVNALELIGAAAYVEEVAIELVLELDAQVVAADDQARRLREIERLATPRLIPAVALVALYALAAALAVAVGARRGDQTDHDHQL